MPVLSRAGCNSGPCHGNLNGRGGLRLSLRGQDADFDLAALTREGLGRRLDRLRPDDSLMLAKATMRLPHEGGLRFRRDSLEYAILRRWIAEGAGPGPVNAPTPVALKVTPAEAVLFEPDSSVPLKAVATFSDGRQRDVTRLATFEPSNLVARVDGSGMVHRLAMGETAVLVRYLDRQAVVQLAFVPARPGFTWPSPPEHNFIDRHLFARLKRLRMRPSGLCSDSEFLRRAYLDALGVLPTPEEARRFLADRRPDKRARLVDELLLRPEFNDFWALKWSDLLRNEEKVLDRKGVRLFHAWLRQAFVDRKPLNELARELIAARGSSYSHPAANYYRALRGPYERGEATAQVFLGVRLQCAKCHNHPFDRWTQDDYHRWAAFFARVQYRIVENKRRDKLDSHEFDGEQVVYLDRESELLHPVTRQPLRPAFLGAGLLPEGRPDRLRALADWVARPDNPFFARAQVNRVWHHLLGRGLVEPNDDFRASNPPANGPLLEALAKDFVEHRFDLRHLVRTIMTSRAYQLSAAPDETNRDDENNFARALVRPLQAEQLLDAVAQVTGVPPRFAGFPRGLRAGQLPGVGAGRARGERQGQAEKFLAVFGKPVRLLNCECERSDDSTLAQALQLITGPTLNRMLAEPDNRLGRLIAVGRSDGQIIEELYLTALSRPPGAEERRQAAALVRRGRDRREALEDVLWGLVNAKEFLLRR
jgi:hypothetical protein